MNNRRVFFTKISALSASLFAGRGLFPAQQSGHAPGGMGQMDMQDGNKQNATGPKPATNVRVASGTQPTGATSIPAPVSTPDIPDLPFTIDRGVKAFHLVAEPVKQMVVPGRAFDLWGFNGSAPGPTIQANEGDRIRV